MSIADRKLNPQNAIINTSLNSVKDVAANLNSNDALLNTKTTFLNNFSTIKPRPIANLSLFDRQVKNLFYFFKLNKAFLRAHLKRHYSQLILLKDLIH